MVDAAVGGKTGINTSIGKNLVGSFYPATSVIADMDLLDSLPGPDLAAGAAEVIKCGFVADPQILRIVESTSAQDLLRPDSPQLADITSRAIAVKARVVSADLTEGGLREILNYGHTNERTTTRGVTEMQWPSDVASLHDSLTPAGS